MADDAPLTLRDLAGLGSLGLELFGEGTAVVRSVTEDSRRVTPGALFVARRGEKSDGTRFVDAAFEQGAVAVLAEPGSGITRTPRLETSRLGWAWGTIAEHLAGRPSESMRVVGITGTNGKTTTTSLVVQALEALGIRTARLGTLGFYVGDEKVFDTLTTPQPDELARALALARDRGVEVCVMEVSSHALAQDRVAGVRFDVAACTNLSQDHLDYHGTMEAYGNAKAKLFREYAPRRSVFFVGDAFGARLAAEIPGSIGVSTRADESDISAGALELGVKGIRAEIRARGETVWMDSRLVGLHNVENLLVALGILLALEVPLDRAVPALGSADRVAGRLERVDEDDDDVVALVDYAHTPDALRRVLGALRSLGGSTIVCVFGCGGDRDRSKRAPMGEAVRQGADMIFLTSDNPRTEDPLRIVADVRPGLHGAAHWVEEVDRARAIERAILEAPSGAVVLVAGKGHENYQIVGNEVRPFDDVEHVRAALRARRAARRAS